MRNKIAFFVVPVVLLLALGGAGAWWMGQSEFSETDGDLAQLSLTEAAAGDNAAEQAKVALVLPEETAPAEMPAPAPATATPEPSDTQGITAQEAQRMKDAEVTPAGTPANVEMPAPKAEEIQIVASGTDPNFPKSIGSLDAPVTMTDYSSLTCPHCARMHSQVLPQLIKNYVETGKLRIIFSDFPLNKEALDASKVSRCISNERYFNFLTLLFNSIEQWALGGNHPNALIQNAVMAGLPEEKARECLNSPEIEKALIAGVQQANQLHKINATPSFIFDDGAKTLFGERPYQEFADVIEGLLSAKGPK